MSSYVISCCSTADLTEEHFSKREISYICFHYKLNATEYADDLGKSMPFDQVLCRHGRRRFHENIPGECR